MPPLASPPHDPTPIFELFRGAHATELLTVAVAHFRLFDRLAARAWTFDELRGELGLERRPAHVLCTALRAMQLLAADADGRLAATPLARSALASDSPFSVGDYVGLAADSPGVLAMLDRLRTNRPAGAADPAGDGAAFIFREGLSSAMDVESSARRLTLSLAGRAKNVAPVLAARMSLAGARRVLDVGGGSGIYSIALLRRRPQLTAVVYDRPEVLKVAQEMAAEYGVADRLETVGGDMFADPLPTACDLVLLSNVLHDWDEPENRRLLARCAAVLPAGGQVWIHDVFLNDALDGPLAIALYSAALFSLTEGRAYSAAEHRAWLADAGLTAGELTPTLVHCGVLAAVKP